MKTIVLTGGGTGGHIYPALALVPALSRRFNVVYMGGAGMEKDIVPKAGLRFYETKTVKLDRSKPFSNLKLPLVLSEAVREAKAHLIAIAPVAVFSKGGYASLPATLAAKKLKIPVITHESDMTMGLANKIISSFATKTLTSFPETKGGVYTGNPVRETLLSGVAPSYAHMGFDTKKKTVMFFGGSLGATFINNAVYNNLEELTRRFNVIHLSGKSGDQSIKHSGYFQLPFTDNMGGFYAVADAVVSRGGANALAEIDALGKRAIIIPLPKGASRGDQVDNAKSYAKRGKIEVMTQGDFSKDALISALERLVALPKFTPKEITSNAMIVREILGVTGDA